jgi:hypothetical protein
MAIETLGEACSQGWRVTVRCAYGRSEGPRSQSSRECNYRKELDMDAGARLSALAAGKPPALPALRVALCGRALRTAAPRRRALDRPPMGLGEWRRAEPFQHHSLLAIFYDAPQVNVANPTVKQMSSFSALL